MHKQHVVLVVGTNLKDNIGAAVCKKFDLEGATVMTMDKNQSGVDYTIDSSDPHAVLAAFEDIKARHGVLDSVLCCQGVNLLGKIEEYTMDNWFTTINANLTSLMVLLQAYVKTFDNDGNRKAFVVITSDTSEIPKTSTFAYGASKAGANHFLRCTARELNKYHKDEWLVTGLAVGMVEGTPMDKKTIADLTEQRGITPEQARAMLVANIPLARGLTTDEVAEWMYFVTTQGDYATGNIIRIDAGQCQG